MDSSVLGLIAGALHHSVIQYPYQAELLIVMYAFALANVVFTLMLFWSNNAASGPFHLGQILKDVLIFNAVYVRPSSRPSDCI